MTAAIASTSVPAFGLQLDPQKPILHKITVNRRDLVPKGLTEVSRLSDKEMDRKHAEEARERGDARSAIDGKVRPGRVDTGRAVYQNVQNVQIASIRSLMALKGYRLGDAHYFVKRGQGKYGKDQFVVVMYLSTTCDPIELSEETVEGLRELARGATYTAHVWDNIDTQTLNFVGRQPGAKPKAKIVVRDGCVQILELEGEQDVAEIERQEDTASAEEIERLLKHFSKQK